MNCTPFTTISSEEKCDDCGGWFGDHDDDCSNGDDDD